MAPYFLQLLIGSAICPLVCASGSFMVPSFRGNHGAALYKRQNTTLKGHLDPELYWYGMWDVGDSKNLKLLIDTGSTDLYLNKGVYKPSSHRTRYDGNQTFSGGYEGINRAGFGFELVNGTVQRDIVSAGGLTVESQVIGVVTSEKFLDTKNPHPKNTAVASLDGIIGFLSRQFSGFSPQAFNWFHNLCHENLISECKFALAFGTSGKGQVVVGGKADQLIDGPLVPLQNYAHYSVYGDIVFENKTIFENQSLVMDVGTNNIQAPLAQAKYIFKQLGYPTVEQSGPNDLPPYQNITTMQAFFPCNKPPSIAFAFPTKSQLMPNETQRIFYVPTSTGIWDVYNHGNNNCTSILGGTDFLNDPITHTVQWLVGQPFFASHYIEFSAKMNQISIGNLANPSG